MNDIPLCHCGRPTDTGWSDGEDHDECVRCVIEADLAHVGLYPRKKRPEIVCSCCGRKGPHGAHQLIASCYAKWLRLRVKKPLKTGRHISSKTRAIYAAIQAGSTVKDIMRDFHVSKRRFYEVRAYYAKVGE